MVAPDQTTTGRPKLGNSPIFSTGAQLADKLGVDRRDVTRFELLAHIPAEVFEEYVLEADAPSYSGCVAFAQHETAPGFGSAQPLSSEQFLKVAGHGVATAKCHNAALFAMTEWLTPPEFFDAMAVSFDLDVASPGATVAPWIPAHRHLTQRQDGLTQPWGEAFVWMNCPYGLRNGLLDWIDKFLDHGEHKGNGVALLPDFTSTD
jgi:hypothetical protein